MAMVKLVGTLLLTWFFTNTVYALHYAHLYYSSRDGNDAGGIDFPGTKTPDYLDFVYFSFTLGMTFQTSDTAITSRTIRRIATAHSFAAFVFNIGVIAFTIFMGFWFSRFFKRKMAEDAANAEREARAKP